MFSAVTSAFIVQIIPELQPDPTDLTNVLLLRILQHNASFDGLDPLTPIRDVPASAVRAQSILFVCLSITLFVAFIAVLGKQWILYYTRATSGSITDQGKERQAKFAGFQKWGVHLIMESLPVMLQLALLLFGVALAVYLWDFQFSAAGVVLVATSVGLTFYIFITLLAVIYNNCPFQTPLSILLPLWWKKFTAFYRARWMRNTLNQIDAGITDNPNTIRGPEPWRNSPLFTSPIQKDTTTSAGIWLLENSTDSSAASAVAAVFPDFQLPPRYHSTTVLIRLRHAYEECFQASELKESSQLKALQLAATYYVLYHAQLFWNTSSRFRGEVGPEELPPDLPPDLLPHLHSHVWGGHDLFEYLLRNTDRSEPVTSVRFLYYIAPYWYVGNSDFSIKFRPNSLRTLYKLIEVSEKGFEKSQAEKKKALEKSQAMARQALEESQALEKEALEGSQVMEKQALETSQASEELQAQKKRVLEKSQESDKEELEQSQVSEKKELEQYQASEKKELEQYQALERSQPLDRVALVSCILCVGAAMGFPLHPEDLIRAKKRCVLHPCSLTSTLIGDSNYVGVTFRLVVEHIHGMAFTGGNRRRHTKTALDILHTLVRKTKLPLVDPSWINDLLMRAAKKDMDDYVFTSFLKLSAQRKEGDPDAKSLASQGHIHSQAAGTEQQPPRGTTLLETGNPERTLFIKISQNVQASSENDGGWEDDAVYGGLIAMRDIPRLGSCLPDGDSLVMLFGAMGESRPFRVREAAYDIMLTAREEWLRSTELRQSLENLDFPRQLHGVITETGRSDHHRPFLMMMEILSEDRNWYSYLRGAMEIWLPFRHEEPDQVIRIFTRVGELEFPRDGDMNPTFYELEFPWDGDMNPPFDELLVKLVEDEWAGVPGRRITDLTSDRLEPLVEITTQLKFLSFTEVDRVLGAVERAIPALEGRREEGYEGPGEQVRNMVEALVVILQTPVQSSSR